MPTTVLITGSGSGFGLLTAKTLANAGYVVYGGLLHPRSSEDRDDTTHIRDVILDITDNDSIAAAIKKIVSEAGQLDCLVHNAGHMGTGPAEAFSPEQFHQYYEINAVGAHRLNQAVLPLMRKAGRGHIVWVSSSSARGGSGPLLAPYFAAKAAMHSLAISLSTEIACWGIETTIVVPGWSTILQIAPFLLLPAWLTFIKTGIFTSGTNHFTNAGKPASADIAAEYMEGPLKGADSILMENVNETFPKDASPQLVADAILKAVSAPRGNKPLRIPVDPFEDGSDEIMGLADEKHDEFLKRCGIYEICSFHEK